MRTRYSHILAVLSVVGVLSALLFVLRSPDLDVQEILSADIPTGLCKAMTVVAPPDGALFPLEIAAPTFSWSVDDPQCDAWAIRIAFQDGDSVTALVREPQWVPPKELWETIKKRSLSGPAEMVVLGIDRSHPTSIRTKGRVSFTTSPDEVGAPLFYREVNLPFIDAVKDPTRIRWRFGAISSETIPPVILENVPVCGNCHSFPRDGSVLAMDVDYANSKGSYVMTRVAREMTLATSDIITWNDYRQEDGQQTFGFLSQISPDGRYVVSTVKDRSVFVPRPDLAFSQLFFPIKGILCIYDRQTEQFAALPGADDPDYVQSNPTWSPDGKYIVFARSRAYQLRNAEDKNKVLLSPEDCAEFVDEGKPFLYDLYRIAFNDGKGGVPQPIPGASHNGRSNYFARYAPDGRWIVFSQARSYMLLQPDSQLYIIPAEGGEARRLECNTARMNSWHSWSPNSKWLVFSSKTNSDYTQLFLTHIDEVGCSSPAICLSRFTEPDRAANIPEFVNASPKAIAKIHEDFLNDYSFVRAADAFFRSHDTDSAMREYRKALELNPDNVWAHRRLGFLLFNVKEQYDEGLAHLRTALELAPRDPRTHHDLGMALLYQGHLDSAVAHLSTAIKGMPDGLGSQYDPVQMRYNLAQAYLARKHSKQARDCLSEALLFDPNCAEAHYALALALMDQDNPQDVLSHYRAAVTLRPGVDNSPILHDFIAGIYLQGRDFKRALAHESRALELARLLGDPALIRTLEERHRICSQLAARETTP